MAEKRLDCWFWRPMLRPLVTTVSLDTYLTLTPQLKSCQNSKPPDRGVKLIEETTSQMAAACCPPHSYQLAVEFKMLFCTKCGDVVSTASGARTHVLAFSSQSIRQRHHSHSMLIPGTSYSVPRVFS
jgi:hypothetical protein